MKVIHSILLLLVLTSPFVTAEDFISLNDDELTTFAILFAAVTHLDRQSGNQFPATVVVSPEAISAVTLPYSGIVERWYATPGKEVEAGDVLALIGSPDVMEIQNQWLMALTELERADSAWQRDKTLFQQGIISERRLQQSEREYRQTQLAVDGAAARLSQAGFNEADLNALQNHDYRLGSYQLRAPVTGMVTHRALTTGEYANAFSELVSLQGSSQPWLSAQVPARLAAKLVLDQTLGLADSDTALTLRQKDRVIDESTQTVEILAEFNGPVDYQPGQIVNLVLAPQEDGILVPADAVVHSGHETIVYVRVPGGVEARSLELQAAGNNYVARAGLKVGEQVVVQGASVLKGMQLGLGQGA